MPKLYTNDSRLPVIPDERKSNEGCVASYEQYAAQRVVLQNVPFEEIQHLTADFKQKIAMPVLSSVNPNIEMGEYFVIPVKELKEMLEANENIEFVQVCNALRSTKNSNQETKYFPVTIIVPVQKAIADDGRLKHEVCIDENSVYCEAYSCPPDRRCPKTELHGIILKDNEVVNDFRSLL